YIVRSIQVATDDRMADLAAVDAQLMRASRYRPQLDVCAIEGGITLPDLEVGQGLLAALVADFLAWPSRPVGNKWQVDRALVLADQAGDHGIVGLADLALLEGARQRRLCLAGAGKDHQAGGVEIEAMDQLDAGIDRLKARNDAVLVGLAATRYRQQEGRFVHHQDGVILMHDADLFNAQRHNIVGGKGLAHGTQAGVTISRSAQAVVGLLVVFSTTLVLNSGSSSHISTSW